MSKREDEMSKQVGADDIFSGRNLREENIEIMSITPEIADQFLKRNRGNRPISRAKIERYAGMIDAGTWPYNGSSVSIGRTGRVLNGQHRFLAVKMSGKPIRVAVAWGVDEKHFATIDASPGRTGADVAGLLGWQNASVAAAAVSVVTAYDAQTISWGGWHALTVHEVPLALKTHPEVAQSIATAYPSKGMHIFRQAWFPAAHYILARINKAEADAFFASLIDGDGLKKGEPIWALRETLVDMNGSKRKPLKCEPLGLTIRTWNAIRRKVSTYKVQRPRLGETAVDPFPRAL